MSSGFDWNSVDNTPLFYVLLNSVCAVLWSAVKRKGKAGMGSWSLLGEWLGTSLLVGGGESVFCMT